ncbi:MAG: DMT family transporter [Betaproteobacteria bacterium]|nr:DMT family transporter [Betaproteobacteria bacterium]
MVTDPARHRRAVALMFCAGLLWSIAGVFTRHIEQASGWETTFWRSFFCAVAMLAILAVLHRGDSVGALRRLGGAGLASGALWAVMFTGFMLALTQTSTANTLILTSISPLTASLFAWLLLGEKVPRRTWLLIGVALAGILVMFGGEAGGGRMAGNLIALTVPLAAGLNFVLMRKAGARVDLIPAVLVGGLLSALATLPLAWPFLASPRDLGILALLGALQLALPCALAVVAARSLSPTEVALIGLTECVFGPIWAWLGAGERPTSHALLGGMLVLGALSAQALAAGARTR